MRSLLNELILEKERREGRRIYNKEIAARTGINENTLGRWRRPDPLDQVWSSVAIPLCQYFECNIGDLVTIDYIQPEGERQVE